MSALACPLDRLPAAGPLTPGQAAVVAGAIVNLDAELQQFMLRLSEELTFRIAVKARDNDAAPRRSDGWAFDQVPKRRFVVRAGAGFTEWQLPPWTAQEMLGRRHQPRRFDFPATIAADAKMLFEWLTISPFAPGADNGRKVFGARAKTDELNDLATAIVTGRVEPTTLRRGDGIRWRGEVVATLGIVDRSCRRQLHELLGEATPWHPNSPAIRRRAR